MDLVASSKAVRWKARLTSPTLAGMVLFIPLGDVDDPARTPEFYDSTFGHLAKIGVPVLR